MEFSILDPDNTKIETKNLILIQCTVEILEKGISGNTQLAERLQVLVEDSWSEFGVEALQYALNKLSESDDEKGWWTYLPIHKQDNALIGSGGYQGKPTAEGTVEIGYEIKADYRGLGLATEMTTGLVENAFRDERVNTVVAHTLGHENPSTRVLSKCGFTKIEEIDDPDEGVIWKWELKRH